MLLSISFFYRIYINIAHSEPSAILPSAKNRQNCHLKGCRRTKFTRVLFFISINARLLYSSIQLRVFIGSVRRCRFWGTESLKQTFALIYYTKVSTRKRLRLFVIVLKQMKWRKTPNTYANDSINRNFVYLFLPFLDEVLVNLIIEKLMIDNCESRFYRDRGRFRKRRASLDNCRLILRIYCVRRESIKKIHLPSSATSRGWKLYSRF